MLEIDYSSLNKILIDKYGRVSGIFAINKKKGEMSHDLVDVVRDKFKTRKVGHAGALDPFAEGLMLILVGEFTKKSDMLINEGKSYICDIVLGIETDSHDVEGNIIKIDENFQFSKELLEKVVKRLNKNYIQYVPIFSSVKVNGMRLRELARNSIKYEVIQKNDKKIVRFELGVNAPRKFINKSENNILEVELPFRRVKLNIKPIKYRKVPLNMLIGMNIDKSIELNVITMKIDCSKGTYIRQLAYDVGVELGSVGMVYSLIRTRIGKITYEHAINIEDLKEL